jgi:polyhydroxyalkanoate synthase subunit PhaE
MNEKDTYAFDFTKGINTWMQSMGEFWSATLNQMDSQKPTSDSSQAEAPPGNKTRDAIATALKNWQALALSASTPESVLAFLKGGSTMPEMMLKLSQTSMDGMADWHQSLLQRFSRLGESVEAYQFQDIDENLGRLWTDIYEKEFHQFFQLPQLGLMRQYQERVNQASDKYHLFQSKLSEYLNMLSIPFSRAAQAMQEKVRQMMEAGELPDDTKVYYNMWIKILEGHFMTLFQTPEYVTSLGCTLNALADFTAARDAVIEDALSILPVARQTDLDDVSRELFALKKRLAKLEKEQHQTIDQ